MEKFKTFLIFFSKLFVGLFAAKSSSVILQTEINLAVLVPFVCHYFPVAYEGGKEQA